MSDFYKTVMGQRYYGGDFPRLVKALEKIASKDDSDANHKIQSVLAEQLESMIEKNKQLMAENLKLQDALNKLVEKGNELADKAESLIMETDTIEKEFQVFWFPPTYNKNAQVKDISHFTEDNGYSLDDIANINNLDVLENIFLDDLDISEYKNSSILIIRIK